MHDFSHNCNIVNIVVINDQCVEFTLNLKKKSIVFLTK